MSKLDYCNSLLAGTTECYLTKVQCIQNIACQVVCNLHKFDHVNDWMHRLHWLKFQKIIAYKMATLVHQCKTGSAPQYLIDFLPSRFHQCILRSSTSDNMQPIFCKTSLALKRFFSSAGPRIWNSLPPSLKAERDISPLRKALRPTPSCCHTVW